MSNMASRRPLDLKHLAKHACLLQVQAALNQRYLTPPENICMKCFSAYKVSLFALKAARMMLKTTVGPAMSDKATAGLGSKGVSISRLPYLTATEPAGLRAVQIVDISFPFRTQR